MRPSLTRLALWPDLGRMRFPFDANQLYHTLDSDGSGEVTFEEIDPAGDELWDAWLES